MISVYREIVPPEKLVYRLFEHLKVAPVALEDPQVSTGKGVTHLTYRIKK